MKYAPANRQPRLLDLTHPVFQAWLAKNGISPPPNDAINLAAAWNDLAVLEAETGQK